MNRNLILLLLFVIVTSCNDAKKEEEQSFSDSIVAHFPQWNSREYRKPNIVVTTEVQQLVQTLAQDTIVPSHRFPGAYSQLKAAATDDELILLTTHTNPVIRCHAYNALVKREYKAIHRVCFAHFTDTVQKVHCRVKGRVIPLSVRTWMVWQLRPDSGSKYSFEPRLYRRYIREYNDLARELKKGSR
jgi:hypothetical protein